MQPFKKQPSNNVCYCSRESFVFKNFVTRQSSCVGAARKVSPNWSLETMTCHSSHCFNIVWG